MTLEFHNEKEFHDHLTKNNLRSDYAIKPAGPGLPGSPALGFTKGAGYPSQQGDDYLHEERFTKFRRIVLIDHITTRKMDQKIIPSLTDPKGVDFFNIRQEITNTNGDIVIFHDVYSWINEYGQSIFNLNKMIWYLWDWEDMTHDFPIKQIHTPTKKDLSYIKDGSGERFAHLRFDGIAAKYPR